MDQCIEKLPEEAQSQLRSNVKASSITNFVIELVENSIEANATSVAIRIDLQIFKLQIIDNGHGLTKDQLEYIGNRYYTTKWNATETNPNRIEHQGEMLASLRKCCSKLMIISKADGESSTYCKVFDSTGFSAIFEAEHQRYINGTTIVVENILANVPVRQLCVTAACELLKIKEYVRAVSLVHPSIMFIVQDDAKHVELLRIKRTNSTIQTLKNLFPRTIVNSKMVYRVVAQIPEMKIKAMIYGELSKSRKLQFVFVNKHYVVKSDVQKFFHSLIFKIFSRAAAVPIKEGKRRCKSIPVFALNILCAFEEYDMAFESNDRRVIFKNVDRINYCLVEVAKIFAKKCGFEQVSTDTIAADKVDELKKIPSFRKFEMLEKYFERLNYANTVHGLPATRKKKTCITKGSGNENTPNVRIDVNVKEKCCEIKEGDTLVTPSDQVLAIDSKKEEKCCENCVQNILSTQKLHQRIQSQDYSVEDCFKKNSDISTSRCLYKIKREYYLKKEFKEFVIRKSRRKNRDTSRQTLKRPKRASNYLHKYLISDMLNVNDRQNVKPIPLKYKNIIKDPILRLEKLGISTNGYLIEEQTRKPVYSISDGQILGIGQVISPYFISSSGDANEQLEISNLKCNNLYFEELNKSIDDDGILALKGSPTIRHTSIYKSRPISNCHTPSCQCSCHASIYQRDLRCVNIDQLNRDNMCGFFNEPKCTNSLMDSNYHYPITPQVASPSILTEAKKQYYISDNSDSSEPVPAAGQTTNAQLSNVSLPSTKDTVVCNDATSVQNQPYENINLRKYIFKTKCKVLENMGIYDVPKGMLDSDALKKKFCTLPKLSEEETNNLKNLLKSYSMKNHITLDDDGNSCLKIFPYLKRENNLACNSLYNSHCDILNCGIAFTKADLSCVKFLAQVDKKFLLAKLSMGTSQDEIIVIFDQHAVEERIRLERLMKSYINDGNCWRSVSINPPINLSISQMDIDIVMDFRSSFEEKGVFFEINRKNDAAGKREIFVSIVRVPLCLHNKAVKEGPNFNSCLKNLVELLMKQIIEHVLNERHSSKHFIPESLHDVIKYEACRGAIKFGDKLSMEVCVCLLRNLSTCISPFQCAHGRPSISPLINLTRIENLEVFKDKGNAIRLSALLNQSKEKKEKL